LCQICKQQQGISCCCSNGSQELGKEWSNRDISPRWTAQHAPSTRAQKAGTSSFTRQGHSSFNARLRILASLCFVKAMMISSLYFSAACARRDVCKGTNSCNTPFIKESNTNNKPGRPSLLHLGTPCWRLLLSQHCCCRLPCCCCSEVLCCGGMGTLWLPIALSFLSSTIHHLFQEHVYELTRPSHGTICERVAPRIKGGVRGST